MDALEVADAEAIANAYMDGTLGHGDRVVLSDGRVGFLATVEWNRSHPVLLEVRLLPEMTEIWMTATVG